MGKIIDQNPKSVIKIMREGYDSEFWRLICQAIDENLEDLDAQLIDYAGSCEEIPSEEVKIFMSTYQAKKNYLQKLKETPSLIVNSVMPIEEEVERVDPYA